MAGKKSQKKKGRSPSGKPKDSKVKKLISFLKKKGKKKAGKKRKR
jgi:hypothetical protein